MFPLYAPRLGKADLSGSLTWAGEVTSLEFLSKFHPELLH